MLIISFLKHLSFLSFGTSTTVSRSWEIKVCFKQCIVSCINYTVTYIYSNEFYGMVGVGYKNLYVF